MYFLSISVNQLTLLVFTLYNLLINLELSKVDKSPKSYVCDSILEIMSGTVLRNLESNVR